MQSAFCQLSLTALQLPALATVAGGQGCGSTKEEGIMNRSGLNDQGIDSTKGPAAMRRLAELKILYRIACRALSEDAAVTIRRFLRQAKVECVK
jgi:hypothetical protein